MQKAVWLITSVIMPKGSPSREKNARKIIPRMISGVIIGATLMGLINQGMSIMGIEANYQRVVKGIVLLLAVMFDVLSKREKR